MSGLKVNVINVFPINKMVFGFKENWFEHFSAKLIQPSYLLMALMLVIFIGILALKRFDNADLEKKLWNIPAIIIIVSFWPLLVLAIKELVDMFNTFLVVDIFQIKWEGFGFPPMGSLSNVFGWSVEGIARLLPNLSYWIIYSFYLLFLFFYGVFGPFVLAKGILTDEIVNFLDLLKEIVNLFLWQTTVIILVALIMPSIVSGQSLPTRHDKSIYFMSLVLGILLLFVPSITRKFTLTLGGSYFPPGFRYFATLLGLNLVGKTYSATFSGSSFSDQKFSTYTHRMLAGMEIRKRFLHQQYTLGLEHEVKDLEEELVETRMREYNYARNQGEKLIEYSKKARGEINGKSDQVR
ncbi:MAG: hypothetical protein KDD58_06415 [Bdellovibrionales bacterium]|nr:hypothetical protein [Bdellovibrionales bacterium]